MDDGDHRVSEAPEPRRRRAAEEPAQLDCERARLDQIGQELEQTGWAFELFDARWHLVRVSDETKALVGESDDEKLGCGLHVIDTRSLNAWDGIITDESEDRWIELQGPFYLAADPEFLTKLTLEPTKPEHTEALLRMEPRPPPPVWVSHIEFLQPGQPPAHASYVGFPLQTGERAIGYVLIYGPALPASLLAMLIRGDVGMFERMARLAEPRRVEAAILFADLQASGVLSRRLSSPAFFGYIRALTTAIDQEVVARRRVVGKHAGDGVTAFFVAEDLGSSGEAAHAALDAARAVGVAALDAAAAAGLAEVLTPEDCALNVGVHWGGALYMGQLVTGGRLEVTALGDEVNECARIQQSARDGAVLASKAVLERLGPADAEALALDPTRVTYRSLAQLEGASDKAVRDAGTLAVTEIASAPPKG